MNKCHVPITWVNDQAPAINDTHLNQYDGELDTLDDRVITLDTTKAAQSDMLLAFKDVSLNSTTGVITFTLFNNTTKTIDTLLEKIAINFDYDDDPTSPHYQNLIIELEDGTYKYIDMSALITEYEFTDSSTIDFTVTSGAVSASVIDGSITSSKLDPTFAVTIADAEANGLKSEGYANGTQNGTPVTSGSPYYENNAKYWKEQAQAIASQTLSGLTDVSIQSPQDGEALIYDAANSEWINGKSGILPHVIVISDSGSTVTLTKGLKTVTATETSTGHFEADVDEYGTWTISVSKGGLSATDTIIVDTVKIYSVTITLFNATITVNYPDNMRGQTFTCVNGAVTLTQTAPSNANTLSFSATTTGTWTVTGEYSKSVVITTDGETQTITFYALKTFATATDQEIADMVSEADLGFIDLYDDCGWRIGQEHSVTLTAINASGTYDGVSWSVGESQSAQTVTFVLMHKGLYELVNPVLNKQGQTRNTCSFVVGMKDCLDTKGYMNSTDTNLGSWNGCARRNWCNGGFRSAIPSALGTAFKQFKTITADDNSTSSMTTSNDYFALPAAREVWDSYDSGQIGLNATEWASLTRFTWYETTSNWSKESSGALSNWWHRSVANAAGAFARLYPSNGVVTKGSGTANAAQGLSPFGCM